MATSEREKLEKDIVALTSRRDGLQSKAAAARSKQQELESSRPPFLTRIAEGDDIDRARLGLRDLDEKTRELADDVQAFEQAAVAETEKIGGAEKNLARVVREEAVAGAEIQIGSLNNTVDELLASIAVLNQKAENLLAGAGAIGKALADLDQKRFSNIGPNLQQRIRHAIYQAFVGLGSGSSKPSADFFAPVAHDLGKAVAQLRYSLLDGDVRPARGERLFVCRVACPGVRGIDLRIGDRIGLTEVEAAGFVRDGSMEMLPQAA